MDWTRETWDCVDPDFELEFGLGLGRDVGPGLGSDLGLGPEFDPRLHLD